MRFDVVTIFPEIFRSFLGASLVGKAIASGRLAVGLTDPREFTRDRHRSVDDAPYGSGPGMVMKPEPLVAALESIAPAAPGVTPHRVLLTPQGERLTQAHLHDLAARPHVVLLCGRYEGVDERVRAHVHQEISLGDFVLGGGETAAMALIEGVARLVPGVIGSAGSLASESHQEPLLEYPQYTRPAVFRGEAVPEVLRSGDHARIARWRRLQQMRRTRARRPDLWARFRPTAEDRALLAGEPPPPRLALAARTHVALLHHPVRDRTGAIVTTAVTNLDIHDIARSARTYGLAGYHLVTPLATQRALVERIVGHWRAGRGGLRHHRRAEALALVRVAADLDEVVARVAAEAGRPPLTVATTAAERPGQIPIDRCAAIPEPDQPLLLILGTGWGLAEEVLARADRCLAPLRGAGPDNHLSVRSAAAILLDRMFGLRDDP